MLWFSKATTVSLTSESVVSPMVNFLSIYFSSQILPSVVDVVLSLLFLMLLNYWPMLNFSDHEES